MDPSQKKQIEFAHVLKAQAIKPIVFLIDDEEDLLFLVGSRLKRSDLEVRAFLTAAEFKLAFVQFLKEASGTSSSNESSQTLAKAFIVTDFRLSDSTGLEILSNFANEPRIIGAALQTGFYLEDESHPNFCFPFRVFEKPVDFEELLEFIEDCNKDPVKTAIR